MNLHHYAAVALLWPNLLLAQADASHANLREFLGLGAAPDTAAAKLGEPLYKENCATCHGAAARGAQGPNLIRSPLVLHDEKGEDIGVVILKGRPQAGMPAFTDLTGIERYQISEYLHQQVELAANRGTYRDTYNNVRSRVTGNPEKGRNFFDQNCTSCHSVTGNLAHIGMKYPQASALLTRIAWPASNVPRKASVITSGGEKISGDLIKLDDFDVSLRDAAGSYLSWKRPEVHVEVLDQLIGHRTLLPLYTDANLHDLTAYLASIK